MPKTAKPIEAFSESLSRAADGDVLHFLSRTLLAHILDAEPHDVLEKLKNLLIALEQQEATLSDWPPSASKDRICAALAKARNAVSLILEDLDSAAQGHSVCCPAKAM